MIGKKKRVIFVSLISVLIVIGITFWYIYQKKDQPTETTKVTEIALGEVYTFTEDNQVPGHIKFIDKENYVAIPVTKSPENSFGDAETYDITFIEGKYSLTDDKFYLGKEVSSTTLSFDDEDSLDSNKYTEMYKSDKPSATDFETGGIEQDGETWVYHRKINDVEVDFPLEKSKKNLPETTNDFLRKYKKLE